MTAEGTVHHIGCPLCEASCGLKVRLDAAGQIQEIRGDPDDPLSRGHICPKGVALQDLHSDPRRLRRPMYRVGSQWSELDWSEAIRLAAEGLVAAQSRHGQDAVAVYLGNPNVHSLGALTHGIEVVRALRSRNTYSATSVDQLPHQVIAWALYGHQFLLPVPDIDRTDLLVLIGHNPMASNGSLWTVPDLPNRLRELRSRGGRLVVFDPRRTETARVADEHHPIRPGTDAVLLLAMLQVITSEKLSSAAAYVDGVDEIAEAVADFTPEVAEQVTMVPADVIGDLARDLCRRRAAVHARMGASTQEFGLICQWAVQALMALSGNLDREGGLMFTDPGVDLLRLLSPGARGRWHSRVRGLAEFAGELPVSALAEEMLTPGQGQIRALLSVAGNPVSSTPDGARLGAAIDDLEFYVAIDPYLNATTRRANVVLPPTGPLERDHYDLIFHTLAVRNTARFSPALYQRGPQARHDWEISRDLVRAIHRARGTTMPAASAARLRLSPRRTLDALLRTSRHRLSVRRLLANPGGVDLGPLTPCLPDRLFTEAQRVDLATPLALDDLARLRRVHLHPSASAAPSRRDAAALLPLALIGRRHQRDNNSWMGGLERLSRGRSRHDLIIHPHDAQARGISDGDVVRVRSAVGQVQVECRLSDEVMPGVVCLPHGYGHGRVGVSMNDLTDPSRIDEASGNAVLNGTPVEVSLLDA